MLNSAEILLNHMFEGKIEVELKEIAENSKVELIWGTEENPQELYTHNFIELANLAGYTHDLSAELPDAPYYHADCAFWASANALYEALGRTSTLKRYISIKESRQYYWDAAEKAAIAYAAAFGQNMTRMVGIHLRPKDDGITTLSKL